MATDAGIDERFAHLAQRRITSVAIFIAMEAEAAPFIEHLGLVPHDIFPAFAPIKCFTGIHNGYKVSVIQPGKCATHSVCNVGTVPASVSVYAALERLHPDLLINAGTAGGFGAKGAGIGDVFVSSVIRNHDRRIPIPGYDAYGVGEYHSVPTVALRSVLGYKWGVVTTGNSLDRTEKDDELMRANDASVKDMEAAGIAWIAELFKVPVFAVKVVTDIVDGDRPTQEEFLENLHTAAESLQRALPQCLDFVFGKTFAEL